MFAQFGEAPDDEKFLSGRSWIQLFVFQYPGVAVRDEDGVQSGGQRGVDVGLWAVADHPGRVAIESELLDDARIGRRIFFGNDFRVRKILSHSRALDLARLLGYRSLGHQDKAVTILQVLQSFRDFRKKVDVVIGDGVGKADDLCMRLRRDWLWTQPLEGAH